MNPQTLNPKEALAIISQLNLLDYQHIPTYQGGQKGRGVYAQQLKEIMPEAISTFPEMVLDDDTVIKDFLSVDYDWIFVTGMAAIQELNEQNKQLRQAVEDLQQQVEKNLEEKIIF